MPLTELQTEAVAHLSQEAVAIYRNVNFRSANPPQEGDPPPADAPDSPTEAILRAATTQALTVAFGTYDSAVAPAVSSAPDALQRHPESGHLVGIENAPVPQSPSTEYPKWVTPHESWVSVGANETPMALGWPDQHPNWGNRSAPPTIQVMVKDADEEAKATSAKPAEETKPGAEPQAVPHKSDAEIEDEAEAKAIADEEARLAALKERRKPK
jgi:hypothetical protein